MENRVKPLLSICIPTYNRQKYLEECLDSIVQQDGFNEEYIEIVISDNASQDDTKKIVQGYQEKYKNITYFRNAENIGAIKNILGLPRYASGEYVWYLSDDDMLSPIALSTIVPILRTNSQDFILSRFLGFWNGDEIQIYDLNKTGNINQFCGMTEFFEFLGKVRYDIMPYLMLLSIFCFRKTVFEEHIKMLLDKNGEEYMNQLFLDNFIHARIMYMPFGEQKKITVIERDLVLCRGDNISWTFHFGVCQDLDTFISDLYKQYKIDRKTYRKLKNIYYYSVFSYVVIRHIKPFLPNTIYNFCVQIGRKFFVLIRTLRSKFL